MAYTPYNANQPKSYAELMQLLNQRAQPTGLNTQTPGYFGQINIPVQTGPGSGYNPRNILQNQQTGIVPNPNATPKNQKAAIIMGALSDIFKGQDTTQNTVLRQQQMVAMDAQRKAQERFNKAYDNANPQMQKIMAGYTENPKAWDAIQTKLDIDKLTNTGTSLIDNTNFISGLYAQRDSLEEGDPRIRNLDIKIRNAEAGIGAYKYDPNRQFDIEEQKRIAGSSAGLDLSDYQRKTDEAFATEAVEFETTEKWQLISNLDKLDQSIAALKESDNLTGPIIGNTPKVILAFTNPEALGLEDDIRSIVYQSLRATLGAQFTEKEGQRLVDASFNQLLGEEVNMKRLDRIRAETYNMMKAKEDRIAYYKKEGTLRGYEGEQSVDSLLNAIIQPEDYAGLSDDQLMTIFKDPNTSEAEHNAIRKLFQKDEESNNTDIDALVEKYQTK